MCDLHISCDRRDVSHGLELEFPGKNTGHRMNLLTPSAIFSIFVPQKRPSGKRSAGEWDKGGDESYGCG